VQAAEITAWARGLRPTDGSGYPRAPGVRHDPAVIAAAIDDAIGLPGAVTRLPATPQRVKALLNATTAQRKRHAAAEG
jgi:hypothetical protein